MLNGVPFDEGVTVTSGCTKLNHSPRTGWTSSANPTERPKTPPFSAGDPTDPTRARDEVDHSDDLIRATRETAATPPSATAG